MKRRPSMNRAKHGKILEEHLKDRRLFTMNNLSTTFRIPKDLFYKERTWATRKGLGLQGQDLSYKEKTCPTRKRLVLQGKDLGYKEKTCLTGKRLELQGKEARPHYYKSPNTPSRQGTHNWPLSSTLELWEYFWLNIRKVFGRLHTGAFCKVFLFSSRV